MGAAARPASLVMIAPIPCTVGMNSVCSITDIWSSPFLSEKWLPIVKGLAFAAYPFLG